MKKYFLFPLLLIMVFSSCETEEPIPTYTLSTSVSPTEGGKITISPQSPNYKEGEVVTLTPEPNEHWVLQKWDGVGSGSSTPLQITMNSNKSVVGVFVKRYYPLKITLEGEGTVEEKIVSNPSGREYPHATTIELTPKPKEGWVFDGWGGDLSGTETPKTITIDKEKNVTVKFKVRDYSLNITIEGEGTVEERIVTNPNGREYPFKTVVELTPVPKEGWVFDSWGGDLIGNHTPNTLTVDKEKNVIVKFKIINEDGSFFLHSNGITCMCPNTQPGDKGFINGIVYESMDNELLRTRIEEKTDLSKLCTSLVTNLSTDNDQGLFVWGVDSNIQSWDVSNVVTMKWMFINSDFNRLIDVWDVNKVKDMGGMFQNSEFNQDLANWDVSNVENMSWMFIGSAFNKPIENWNVSQVTDMSGMFSGSSFNQSVENWNVGKVKNMTWMFASSMFNKPIGNWDVSNVIDMSGMFTDLKFNQPIENWNVSNVINMSGMFSRSQFNQPIGNWNVSKVADMSGMFSGSQFNQPIEKWDVSNVIKMNSMFSSSFFDQPLELWNVSKVTNMNFMFSSSQFNQPIGNWNVSEVTSMSYIFTDSKFNKPIGNWDVKKVISMTAMFLRTPFNQDVSKWCVTNIKSEPSNFSINSPLIPEKKPKWGTCPD